jgi:hypothetical protein
MAKSKRIIGFVAIKIFIFTLSMNFELQLASLLTVALNFSSNLLKGQGSHGCAVNASWTTCKKYVWLLPHFGAATLCQPIIECIFLPIFATLCGFEKSSHTFVAATLDKFRLDNMCLGTKRALTAMVTLQIGERYTSGNNIQ